MSTTSQLGGLQLGSGLLGDTGSAAPPAASFVVTPTTVRNGRTSVVITLVGTSTTWTGGTTFAVSGATKVSQTVTDNTHATVTISTTGAGSITIDDGSENASLTALASSFIISPAAAQIATGVNLAFIGTNTDWSSVGASFAIASGVGSNLHSITITDDTHATAIADFGSAGSTSITDGINSTSITSAVFKVLSKLAPFYQTDTITAPVTAQLRRLVSGSWTNVGSAVAAIATGLTNGYGVEIPITPDANGGWDGLLRWSDSSGSPVVYEEEVLLSPNTSSTTRTITKRAPYLSTDSLTAPVSGQLKRLVSGSWTNSGSAVTAVATGLTNGYGAQFTITPDSDGRFDSIVVWADSAGTPTKVSDEMNSPYAGSSGSGPTPRNVAF